MRFFKRAMLVLFGLFVLWFGLALTKWLPPTTDLQRKAIAIMEAPPAATADQHNAFAALWLAAYDIPAADMDKVMAADVARYGVPSVMDLSDKFVSSAEGKYRKQPSVEATNSSLCSPQGEDCLAMVRSHADTVGKYVAANSLLVDHARNLVNYDSYRGLFPPGFSTPLPYGLMLGKVQITDAALRFVDGDKPEGLARACSAALAWRRLSTHTDSLLVQMIGVANFHGAADLFADMLAETPVDARLPDACAQAFAPVADADLTTCNSMKNEYRVTALMWNQLITDSNQVQPSRFNASLGRLLFNERATDALRAVGLASFCTDDPEIQKAAARMRASTWSQNAGVLGVLFNFVGSMESGTDITGQYSDYATRMQDLRGMNNLVEAALGLRGASTSSGGHPISEEQLRAPGALPSGVEWDTQQHLLRLRRAYVRKDLPEKFSIPLPASRLQ